MILKVIVFRKKRREFTHRILSRWIWIYSSDDEHESSL